jgi:hypothetical protein
MFCGVGDSIFLAVAVAAVKNLNFYLIFWV